MTETEIKPSYLQASYGGATEQTGWIGEWPPPEQMLLIESHYSGLVWRPMQMEESVKNALRKGIEHGWKVTVLARVRYSVITDAEYAEMTHVMRGAEYEIAGPWNPHD